jgi:hypothetical protein
VCSARASPLPSTFLIFIVNGAEVPSLYRIDLASGDQDSMLYGTLAADNRVLVPRSASWIQTSSTSFSFATIAT